MHPMVWCILECSNLHSMDLDPVCLRIVEIRYPGVPMKSWGYLVAMVSIDAHSHLNNIEHWKLVADMNLQHLPRVNLLLCEDPRESHAKVVSRNGAKIAS